MITNNGTDLILAPIAGYSDVGMRTLCAEYGAGLTYTEMVSAKGLHYNNENTKDLLHVGREEKNVGVQLFGSDPDIIAEAINGDALKDFSIVDINMGCPVPKIVNNGEGSALMKNPDLIYKIMKRATEGTDKKITAKIRAGYYNGYENAVECALALQEGGASMVTVHGRTREMFYSGRADYGIIEKVKESLDIPVCGNGDVTDRESYLRMKETTGVDYVMIARGAIGRPYVFADILGREYTYDIKETILRHIGYLSFLPERVVVNCMKKQIGFYVKGTNGQKKVKEKVFSSQNLEELFLSIDLIGNGNI